MHSSLIQLAKSLSKSSVKQVLQGGAVALLPIRFISVCFRTICTCTRWDAALIPWTWSTGHLWTFRPLLSIEKQPERMQGQWMFSIDDRRMVSQVHDGSSVYMSADLYWYRAGGRLQWRWWESLNCDSDGRTSVLGLSLNLSHLWLVQIAGSSILSSGNGLALGPFNPVQTDKIVQIILQRGFAHTPHQETGT